MKSEQPELNCSHVDSLLKAIFDVEMKDQRLVSQIEVRMRITNRLLPLALAGVILSTPVSMQRTRN